MRRSQAMARDSPAPAAAPRTMAMVGLGISCSHREVSIFARRPCALSSIVSPPNSRPSAMALTSPPAQKPRPAPVSTTTPTSGSEARRSREASMASSISPDMALSRSGRFMVRTATPSLTVSSSSLVMDEPSGPWWRLFRRGHRAQIRDQVTDLRIGQMVPEGGHAGLAYRGPAVLDEVEEVLVREPGHAPGIAEVAGTHQEDRRAPRALAARSVTGRAAAEEEALNGRGRPGYGEWEEDDREDAPREQEQRGPRDHEEPFRLHAAKHSTRSRAFDPHRAIWQHRRHGARRSDPRARAPSLRAARHHEDSLDQRSSDLARRTASGFRRHHALRGPGRVPLERVDGGHGERGAAAVHQWPQAGHRAALVARRH